MRTPSFHGVFEPLDFIVRLAALAPKTLALLAGWVLPKPRVNLTRFHGVFVPERYRAFPIDQSRELGGVRRAQSGYHLPGCHPWFP